MAATDVVLRSAGQLCEGPSWDDSTQRLIWVDILSESVHILDPETGKVSKPQMAYPGPGREVAACQISNAKSAT